MLADWFKSEGAELSDAATIKAIEDGMLLPPLCTQAEYVKMAMDAGLSVFSEVMDISMDVSQTW